MKQKNNAITILMIILVVGMMGVLMCLGTMMINKKETYNNKLHDYQAGTLLEIDTQND